MAHTPGSVQVCIVTVLGEHTNLHTPHDNKQSACPTTVIAQRFLYCRTASTFCRNQPRYRYNRNDNVCIWDDPFILLFQ
uniref:Uncharacterized protein n=1 Tax=Anguilla anguilla TaxID=7936 RepID=A0A0E9WW49_ANGAN